jgi:hypothetical protein
MPVESIEVESHKKYHARTVNWSYPYKRLAIKTTSGLIEHPFIPLHCETSKSEAKEHWLEARAVVTNGTRSKYQFDCKRGMISAPIFGDDDPAKALMFGAQGGFRGEYLAVCYKVTHEWPYLPELPQTPNEKEQGTER